MEQKHFSNDLIKFSSIYQDCATKAPNLVATTEQPDPQTNPHEHYYQPIIKPIQPIIINPNRINYLLLFFSIIIMTLFSQPRMISFKH